MLPVQPFVIKQEVYMLLKWTMTWYLTKPMQYGVTPYESAVLVEQPGLASLFEALASPQNGSFVAKWYGVGCATTIGPSPAFTRFA